MCGIAGLLDISGASLGERGNSIVPMTRTLFHRGPDDEGYYIQGSAALGHRRLSIIDVAGGHQPVANEDGTVWVVFNGEIYNYRDLQDLLVAKGHRFATNCDTEAIVHAYEEWGPACVERFRGMFAFAIWDQRRGELFLARDRLGKKPLYYATVGDLFLFASEIKALLAYPGIDRRIDLEALADYFSLHYIPSPKSIFRHIRKLPAGHTLQVSSAGQRVRRYWEISFVPQYDGEADATQRLAELMHEAVALRLRSDVPLGAFLSGGLDSSAVVGLMARALPSPVTTSSIGFSEDDFNELEFARQVAQHFTTDHHEHMVTPDAMAVLGKLITHYDEPFGDASAVPTYYVSQLARTHVTVALSGDGGDENFAGYRRYYFDLRENRVRGLFPAAVRSPLFGLLGSLYPKADFLPQIFRGKAFLSNLARTPWDAYFDSVSAINSRDLAALLSGDLRRTLNGYQTGTIFADLYHAADGPDPLTRIQYIDFKTYLPEDILVKVDRASMAHSLEVRCPLLDHHLVEYVAGLPSHLKLNGSRTKLIFKDALRGLLPETVMSRKKMGFGVPVAKWLRQELRPLVTDVILAGTERHGLLDRRVVERLWQEHRVGLRDRATELWGILIFNLWHDRFAGTTNRAPSATVAAPARTTAGSIIP